MIPPAVVPVPERVPERVRACPSSFVTVARTLAIALGCVAALCVPLHAQDDPADQTGPAGVTLRLDQVDIVHVLDLYTRLTGKVVTPTVPLGGKITIDHPDRVSAGRAAALIEEALARKGLSLVPDGDIVRLTRTGRASGARARGGPGGRGGGGAGDRGGTVACETIALAHVDPRRIVAEVSELFHGTGVTFLPNERLQLLVVSGPRELVSRTRQIVAQLDRPAEEGLSSNQIIPIKYVRASEVADLVETLYKNRVGGAPSRFAVSADRSSNSVVLSGPPELRDEIARLVARVDQRPDQIMLEAVIGDVQGSPTRALGFEWRYLPGQSEAVPAPQAGDPATAAIAPGAAGAAPGVRYSVIDPTEYRRLLQKLDKDLAFNTIASPQITVANNRSAEFKVGAKEPVPTSQRLADHARAVVHKDEYVETGLDIKATPSITGDQEVTLELAVQFSQNKGLAAGSSSPVFSNLQVMTTVVIKDLHTLVLAGLLERQHGSDGRRGSILDRLPVMPLFRDRGDRDGKEEMLVLLTPTIVRASRAGTQASSARAPAAAGIVATAALPAGGLEHDESSPIGPDADHAPTILGAPSVAMPDGQACRAADGVADAAADGAVVPPALAAPPPATTPEAKLRPRSIQQTPADPDEADSALSGPTVDQRDYAMRLRRIRSLAHSVENQLGWSPRADAP